MSEKLSIDERFLLYVKNQLPGQGFSTHMGTYYLMNELKADRDRLTAEVKRLRERGDRLADAADIILSEFEPVECYHMSSNTRLRINQLITALAEWRKP